MTTPDLRTPIRISDALRRRLLRECGRRMQQTGERWSMDRLIRDLADTARVPSDAAPTRRRHGSRRK